MALKPGKKDAKAAKGKEKKNARPARPAPKKRETGRTETIKTTGSKRQKLGGAARREIVKFR